LVTHLMIYRPIVTLISYCTVVKVRGYSFTDITSNVYGISKLAL
jgi:hypothetical protein